MSGNLPGILLERQRVAHGAGLTFSAFDLPGIARHFGLATGFPHPRTPRAPSFPGRATPSPVLRSGSLGAGSRLLGRPGAQGDQTSANCRAISVWSGICDFSQTFVQVNSRSIITPSRGLKSCRSVPLFFSPPSQPRWLAACPRNRNAALPARSSAQPWLTQPMKTLSPAQPLAALRALPRAASPVCQPANRAIDLTARAQTARPATVTRPFGQTARMAFVISPPRPGRA